MRHVDENMFVISPAIGHVPGEDFRFDVLDERIIRQKLLPYGVQESRWLRNYVEQ